MEVKIFDDKNTLGKEAAAKDHVCNGILTGSSRRISSHCTAGNVYRGISFQHTIDVSTAIDGRFHSTAFDSDLRRPEVQGNDVILRIRINISQTAAIDTAIDDTVVDVDIRFLSIIV